MLLSVAVVWFRAGEEIFRNLERAAVQAPRATPALLKTSAGTPASRHAA